MIKEGLDHREIANFIVISLNGAAPLYAASRDPAIWEQTIAQLRYYIDRLREDGSSADSVSPMKAKLMGDPVQGVKD